MILRVFLHTWWTFFYFSFGVKVPIIVKEAKAALDAGYCVVIGLQTTGEVRGQGLGVKG